MTDGDHSASNGPVAPPGDGGPGHHNDDVVLWIVIAFCLLTSVGLVSVWTFLGHWYPPMLIAMLLGIAVAALTYRYLGGTGGSVFTIGLLKVAGSAALLLGTVWFANQGLSTQMQADDVHNELRKIMLERNSLADEKLKLEQQVASLKTSSTNQALYSKEQLEAAQNVANSATVTAILRIRPGTPLAKELIDMARRQRGPFSKSLGTTPLNVTVIGLSTAGRFNACDDKDFDGKMLVLAHLPAEGSDGEVTTVSGRQVGVIQTAVCLQPNRKFDLQMGCADGRVLFPDDIAGCEADGAVKWRVPHGKRAFPVSVEVRDE